ncbi:MAG: hypothetical protein IT256_07930 [Chitinophagaceae bacterium]|nr:hypothetical protein [Chitinophagaceae bacterium]
MNNSKRTLKDLSFASQDADSNVLNYIDRCSTFVGRALLMQQLADAPNSYHALCQQQAVIKYWAQHPKNWPSIITNGTIVMLEKFFESADSYTRQPGGAGIFNNQFFQKIFNKNEYHFTQFSITHLTDFLKGCQEFVALKNNPEIPELLFEILTAIEKALDHRLTAAICAVSKDSSFKQVSNLCFHARRELKPNVQKLINHFALLDAWHGMAIATNEHHWRFPKLLPAQETCFQAEGLYHPFLSNAVKYDLSFLPNSNFMILTGANMSGKTTMMRAMGVSAILAHLGMGVPAQSMSISFLQGVITNMHVEDDLMKGESFFLAEVKNIKQTAQMVIQEGAQLILMDELFKGTNVHDAYECTKAIIEGLLRYPQHILVLSTHLHEVAENMKTQAGLSFYCFHTSLATDGSFTFNYKLQSGISAERIGYKILQREGVIDLLSQK